MEPGEGRPGQGSTVAAAGGERDVLEGSGAKGQGEWKKAAFLG